MTFNSVWPFAFLIFIPVIIFFYILKQKARDMEFSSTMLWREVYRNVQADTPFEKLKNNILMYLQLLLLVLLIAALTAPVIKNAGAPAKNVVVVIDNSASMGYAYDKDTRLDEAKSRAVDTLDSLDDGDAVTLITCSDFANVIYQGTDRQDLKEKIEGISQTNEAGSLDDASELLGSLISGMTNTHVYFYTDTAFDASVVTRSNSGAVYVVDSVYLDGENLSVNYVNYTLNYVNTSGSGEGDDRTCMARVLCSITNYTKSDRELDVTLYADDRAVDIQEAAIPAGSTETVYFDEVELSGVESEFTAGIDDGDDMEADNYQSVAITGMTEKTAVIVSTGNVFLEKALALDENVTVYKTDSADALKAGEDSYDLYVFDGSVSTDGLTMEECGIGNESSILLMGADDTFSDLGGYVTRMEDVENEYLSFVRSDVTDYVSGYTFGVTRSHTYELPEGAEPCVSATDKVAGFVGDMDGVTVAVIGFDIHATDLALRTEFPIFMSQLEARLLGSDEAAKDVYSFPSDEESQVVPAESERGGDLEEGTAVGDRPLRNAILAAVLFLLVLEWVVYIIQTGFKNRIFYLAVRGVLVLLVVLSMLGLTIRTKGSCVQTVFLVDVSDSMSANTASISDYIADMAEKKPEDDSYAVVAFGENAAVEQFMTDTAGIPDFTVSVVKNATNLENAVTTAASMFDSDASKRLVLISDGEENSGSVNNTAVLLKNSKISLYTIKQESTIGDGAEVYIQDVELPPSIHEGDIYSVSVVVRSNVETDAEVTLYEGRSVKSKRTVHVTRGDNRFVFSDTGCDGTVLRYRAVIEPEADTISVNNTYAAYAEVSARPRVLVVLGRSSDKGKLSGVLEAGNIECDEVMASSAPRSIDGLTGYKAVITVNCHYDDLSSGFAASLKTYVKDYAGGYICVGGDSSYALGGYRDTELEEILPVNADLEGKSEIPKMAMVMVIDHSGSMSVTDSDGGKMTGLSLAKQAAISAVTELRDTDEVGILEFDDKYDWVYEISGVSDRDAVNDAIRTIPYGGETSIYPALKEAYSALEESDASIKHIILLTDGQDDFTSGYIELENDINAAGITLSTVAVGDDSDTATLRNLAGACGGRFYYTDINSSIPRIFAQEVYLSTDEYLKNREFYPNVASAHELTQGVFDDGVPALYGYIATSAKAAADVVLTSDEDEPVLATWQYGLGRTIAWCSDGSFGWTAGCAEWEKYPQLWANMVNYVMTDTSPGPDSIDIENADDESTITLTTDSYSEDTIVTAVVTDDEGEQTEVTLYAVKPGTYQGSVNVTDTGIYSVSIRKQDSDEVRSYNTAFAWQYSKEYTFADEALVLEGFTDMAGGSMITMDDDVWGLEGSQADVNKALTPWLLVAAIMVLMADIAVRRLGIRPHLKTCVRQKAAAEKPAKAEPVKARPDVRGQSKAKQSGSLDVDSLLRKKSDRG